MTAAEARKQFDRELKAHITAQQGATGVCQLLGTCEKDHQVCLVMKRYATSLAAMIDGPPLDHATRRRVMHDVAQTLQQLHEAGVVVRDIKPDNVLLDKFGRAHIADFGISTVLSRTMRYVPTTVKGSFNYMAPEAFSEDGIGPEVDIWALGCVYIELCTRTTPWTGKRMEQILRAVCFDRKVPDVPAAVPNAALVKRCFAYEARERPTAAELCTAFAPAAAAVPEIVDDMAGSFARQVAELTEAKKVAEARAEAAETRATEQGRQAQEQRRRADAAEARATEQGRQAQEQHRRADAAEVRAEDERRRADNAEARIAESLQPAVAVPAPAAAPLPSRRDVPPGAVFQVHDCESPQANGTYRQDGKSLGKPRYKNENDVVIGWGVGHWRATSWRVKFTNLYHPDKSADRPPCSGWKKSRNHSDSLTRLVYF
eukprot:CAMPEP_0206292970 /NCGR_PEP_ID=MMETSP0106_2-20121207/3901_1 /ASSEMBLY_ACC=CAM_ASM_000206 /TAXON_ID=81532 /ORGANISM="Acanthoeca-like sp., Strain 10tr" /LENGTH=429 /DNA_ID=CAMNT_0053723561 /DNA_START=3 /DNA_END=1292 /DNA_ORIENTATION=-